mgnify:CR=1 FL=1
MSNLRQTFLPVVVLVFWGGAGASIILEWPNPWRWLLIFIFIVFGPGASFLHFYPGKDAITHLVLSVAVSLSLATAITQILLYAGVWSARLAFFLLISISWFGLFSRLSFQWVRQKPYELAQEMSRKPRFYLYKLWQRAWFILAIGVLLVIFSVIYSYYIASPFYEAVAECVLSPNPRYTGADSLSTGLDAEIVAEYAARLTSPAVIESTFRLLGENMENYVKYKVSTSVQDEMGRIQLRVRGPNPALAASLANSIGQNAAIQMNTQGGKYILKLIEKSPIPAAPSEPNLTFNISVAFLFGLILGCILVLLGDVSSLSYSNNSR